MTTLCLGLQVKLIQSKPIQGRIIARLAAKQWKLTHVGHEALVLHQVLAALRLEVHGGLDMQSEVEGHSPADNQPLLSEKLRAVVAAVLLEVQVIVIQLQSCVHEEGGESFCHHSLEVN